MFKTFSFSKTDEKVIERVVDADVAQINHMVLPQGTNVPEHYSNSNVYMIVIRGTLTFTKEQKYVETYESGTIINIPYNTQMLVQNKHEPVLEFIVVKAPNPAKYSE